MDQSDDLKAAIPLTQVDGLLVQPRFIPEYGRPTVSADSHDLPKAGSAIPPANDSTRILSMHHKNPEHTSLKINVSPTSSSDGMKSTKKPSSEERASRYWISR